MPIEKMYFIHTDTILKIKFEMNAFEEVLKTLPFGLKLWIQDINGMNKFKLAYSI